MAIAIEIDKERLDKILQCLDNGDDLPAPHGGWSGNEMMLVAGACMFSRMSQGPLYVDGRSRRDQTLERREATERTFGMELASTINYFKTVAKLLADGHYDDALQKPV